MRAQGSLEYLIVISVAIAVVAVVSMIIVNSFGQKQNEFVMTSCANAASTCNLTLALNYTASCDFCDMSCNYSNGTEVFPKAAACCKHGQTSQVYGGSDGTNCVLTPPVPLPEQVCLESDGTTIIHDQSCSATKPGKRCVKGVLLPACMNGCSCDSSIYQKCDPANNYCYNISFTETNISNISSPVALAVGDADNDGNYNDMVVGTYTGGGAAILQNSTVMYSYIGNAWIENNISDKFRNTFFVSIGDADNDPSKNNEVVASVQTTSGTSSIILYKFSSGSWVPTTIANSPWGKIPIALGDADNDGKNEVVAGYMLSSSSSELRIYRSISGTWIPTTINSFPCQVYSIAMGDADNQHDNEIIVGLSGTDKPLRMYKNVSGTWVESNITTLPGEVDAVAIGDAKNLGSNQVLAGSYNIPNSSRVYTYSSGTWQETNMSHPSFGSIAPGGIGSFSIGDVDKDGSNEVLVIYKTTTGRSARVYWYNPATGQWPQQPINAPNGFSNEIPRVGAIWDFNHDGINDMLIGFYYFNGKGGIRSYATSRAYKY